MTQPRSSFAIAMQDYKGPRPGIALTFAAVALIAALVVGIIHVVELGKADIAISKGRNTIRTLNQYNAALEVWLVAAQTPDTAVAFPDQIRLRDSIAAALATNLRELRDEFEDPIDRQLISDVLSDLPVERGSVGEGGPEGLGDRGRAAMIVLGARQDSALFQAASDYQSSQFMAAIVIGLTVLAAGILIIPMSWVYWRYKRGVPPGM